MVRQRRQTKSSPNTNPTSKQEATSSEPVVAPKLTQQQKRETTVIAQHAKDTKSKSVEKAAKVAKQAASVANAKKATKAKKTPAKPAIPTPAKKRAVKRGSTPRKHNPIRMFEWYCEDMTRNYADVAKEFKTTRGYVENMAAKEDTTWVERRTKVLEKMQNKKTKRRYKEAQERDDSHLKSFRAAIVANTNTIITEGNKKADKDIKAITASTNALYKAIMGERIILGLPVLIARSEIMTDDEEVETLQNAQITATRMAERAAEIEAMRNNG